MRLVRILPALLLVAVLGCQDRSDLPRISASVETTPVASSDDAADDPAIWVNLDDPSSSLILGTDKRRGLAVYDLAGNELQFIERGRLNNVDVRSNVSLGGSETALAVATNRTTRSLDVFEVSAEGEVSFRLEQPLDLEDPYGVCMMRADDGSAVAFVNGKNGDYQQWQLTRAGELAPQHMGSFTLQSQPEGCVVDDGAGLLYAGEETRGVWVMPADASRADEMTLIDSTDNGPLVADVEGMAVYHQSEDRSYLVVSSQGDDSFAVYHIEDSNRYLGSFRVDDDPEVQIDGVQETDGLDVTAYALGSQFPQGLLVVQDGKNRHPRENQNFKLVDWREVAAVLPLR